MSRNTWTLGRVLVYAGLISALTACAASASSFTQDQIKEALSELRAYDYGKDPTLKHTVSQIVQFVHGKSALRSFTEEWMAALLESNDLSRAAKQFICQQLWIIGSDASIPVLEKMLLDPQTAEMACYALCTNPSEAVNRALRGALARVSDASKVPIVNVLGSREDADSVAQLIEFISAENMPLAQASARALGKIGGDKAAEAIGNARAGASGTMHAVLTEAYLNCAERYAAGSQRAKALAIYTTLLDSSEPLLIRRAALIGALHTGNSRAADLMLAAVQQEGANLRATAIANSHLLPGIEVTKRLISVFETSAPSTQIQLIEALIQRNDPLARNAVTAAANSPDAAVRVAAFDGLAERNDGAIAVLLCDALAKAPTAAEADTIVEALLQMQGEAIGQAILGAVEDASPSMKVQLIEVIGGRGYAPAVPPLLDLCRSNDAAVASAALRAVGALASYQVMPELLELLAAHHDQPGPALGAITAVIRRNESQQTDMAHQIQERLAKAKAVPARCALLRLLSAIPNDRSLRFLEAASKEREPAVENAAIRTLARYPDPAAVDALMQIFQDSAGVHRALALRGCVRLLGTAEMPPEKAVGVYEQLVAHAKTPDEKKRILSGLAKARHPKARDLIERFLHDNSVKAEAALALEAFAATSADGPGEAR